MSQNVTHFQWSLAKRIAAARLAENRLTDVEIASEAGVTRRQFARWKTHPAFASFAAAILADASDVVSDLLIADKSKRVAVLDDLLNRQLAVLRARAEDPDDASSGKESGLLVKDIKNIGTMRNPEYVTTYALDAGLIDAIEGTMKRAAEELGQIETKVKVSGRIRHDHHRTDLSMLSDDELAALEVIARKVETGAVST